MAETNAYKLQNQWTKAVALAANLYANNIPSSRLVEITEGQWVGLARQYGVRPPTFVDGQSETVVLVGVIMQQFEKAKPHGRYGVIFEEK